MPDDKSSEERARLLDEVEAMRATIENQTRRIRRLRKRLRASQEQLLVANASTNEFGESPKKIPPEEFIASFGDLIKSKI